GQGQFRRTRAATNCLIRFIDDNALTRLHQTNRDGESVQTGADDNGVVTIHLSLNFHQSLVTHCFLTHVVTCQKYLRLPASVPIVSCEVLSLLLLKTMIPILDPLHTRTLNLLAQSGPAQSNRT